MAKKSSSGRHWLAPILQNWAALILQTVQVWATQQLQLLAKLAQDEVIAAQEQEQQELIAGIAQTEELARLWILIAQQQTEAKEAQAMQALEARLMQALRSAINAAEAHIMAEVHAEQAQNTAGLPGRGF